MHLAKLINKPESKDTMTEAVMVQRVNNKITPRIDINVGHACNIRCEFCYYIKTYNNKLSEDLTTEEIKRLLVQARKRGKFMVDFTGGEPTMRPDLPELVRFAGDIGFSRICTITNGLMMSRKEYLQKLKDAGLNDILFSVHGHNEDVHDNTTKVKGSFKLVMQAIKNAQELGMYYRMNGVINNRNYKDTEKLFELFASLKPYVANFILYNPVAEITDEENLKKKGVTYTEAAPYIMNAIKEYKGQFRKINIRFMPYCTLPGYEQHISTMRQIQYDSDEWDYQFHVRMKRGVPIQLGATMAGMVIGMRNPYFRQADIHTKLREAINEVRIIQDRVKSPKCKACRFEPICDGFPRTYVKARGDSEINPVPGEKIYDPAHFLKINNTDGTYFNDTR